MAALRAQAAAGDAAAVQSATWQSAT